jgi:superfamily II DNA or RNA helicase
VSLFQPEGQPRDLRDYQAEAIEKLRESLRLGLRRPMLQAPTGAGKTLVAATLVRMAREKDKRVVFVVPALSLVEQTVEAFWNDGVADVGIIQANHPDTDWSRPVQVASVQTLMRRDPLPKADMVLIDEAHKIFEFYGKWMTDPAWQKVPFIGLSATPWAKGLGKLYTNLIEITTTQRLIDQGHLSPFRAFAASHPDLTGVRTVAGDYHEGELAGAMNKNGLVADAVGTWLERGENRPTVCFAVDRAHAKHLQQNFEDAGVPCGYQDMNTTLDERREIKRKFHAGEYKVVTNCETLTIGVDWDIRCISMCRPTKSEMLFVQIIGRGLRTAPGKTNLLVLDHSDNHTRLGFVTDIHHDELHGGRLEVKAERRVPLPKECPKCSYLRPPRVSVCPNCGFKPEVPVAKHVDGDLVELNGSPKPKKLKNLRKNGVMFGLSLIPFAELYGQLQQYGASHGRKPGWSSYAYRELTGVWPNYYRDAPLRPVGAEVSSWIRARNIRWAKSRAPR